MDNIIIFWIWFIGWPLFCLALCARFYFDNKTYVKQKRFTEEIEDTEPDWWTTYFDDLSLDSPEELILFVQDNASELFQLFTQKVTNDDRPKEP